MSQASTFAIPNQSLPNGAALTALTGLSEIQDGSKVHVSSYDAEFEITTQVAGKPTIVASEVIASSVAGRVWQRLTNVISQRWAQQATWFIDSAAGNDENDGASNVTALATFGEFIRRVPSLYVSVTVNILTTLPDADSLVNDFVNRWHQPLSVTRASLTLTGTVTLGGAQVIAASSDEVGNAAPTIDVGAALVVGNIIQSINGANPGSTAVVVALIAGTLYRTSPWRSTAPGRVAPPAVGTTIGVQTRPTINALGLRFASNVIGLTVNNLDIKDVWQSQGPSLASFNVCSFAGAQNIQPLGGCSYNFSGCSFTTTGAIGPQLGGARSFWSLCGIVAPNNTMLVGGFGFAAFSNTVLQNGRIDVGNINNPGGMISFSSLGIYGVAGGTTIKIEDGAIGRIQGTLYGTDPGGGATGCDVREGGKLFVAANITPTLTAGTELIFEGAATASSAPPLATGVIPIAVALNNWGAGAGGWSNPATFNRNVLSYSTGASITNHA
jgi:hypothetical protein